MNGNPIEYEGKWHDTLQHIRVQLRRGMDGETSTNQRRMGLEYGINFGVNLLHLREMARSLPKEDELADLMWSKNVRELRLLSILIRPLETLTPPKALTLAKETDTTELAEQLVFHLFRHLPFATKLLRPLFQLKESSQSPIALMPYLLLNHIAKSNELTQAVLNDCSEYIVHDLASLSGMNQLGSVLYNALVKITEERPDLNLTPIEVNSLKSGTETTRLIINNLQELR